MSWRRTPSFCTAERYNRETARTGIKPAKANAMSEQQHIPNPRTNLRAMEEPIENFATSARDNRHFLPDEAHRIRSVRLKDEAGAKAICIESHRSSRAHVRGIADGCTFATSSSTVGRRAVYGNCFYDVGDHKHYYQLWRAAICSLVEATFDCSLLSVVADSILRTVRLRDVS